MRPLFLLFLFTAPVYASPDDDARAALVLAAPTKPKRCPCSADPQGRCTCKVCKHGDGCACKNCQCELVLEKCPRGVAKCRCGCKEGWDCTCKAKKAKAVHFKPRKLVPRRTPRIVSGGC